MVRKCFCEMSLQRVPSQIRRCCGNKWTLVSGCAFRSEAADRAIKMSYMWRCVHFFAVVFTLLLLHSWTSPRNRLFLLYFFIFGPGALWDWLTFAVRLKWPLKKVQWHFCTGFMYVISIEWHYNILGIKSLLETPPQTTVLDTSTRFPHFHPFFCGLWY